MTARALFFGQLTDRFGREELFPLTLAVYIAAPVATAFSLAPWYFYVARAQPWTGAAKRARAWSGSAKTSPRTNLPSRRHQIQPAGMSRMPSSRLRT